MNWALNNLKRRAAFFYAVAIASFFALVGAFYVLLGESSVIVPVLLVWVGVVGVAQYAWLKCPHCGSPAIILPSGMATPVVGDHCRYCGKPY